MHEHYGDSSCDLTSDYVMQSDRSDRSDQVSNWLDLRQIFTNIMCWWQSVHRVTEVNLFCESYSEDLNPHFNERVLTSHFNERVLTRHLLRGF